MTNSQRKEHAEKVRAELEAQGYTTHIYMVSDKSRRLIDYISLAISVLFLILYILNRIFPTFRIFHISWDFPYAFEDFVIDYIIVFLFMLFGTAIGEGLYGFTWGLFCKRRWKSIDVGDKKHANTPFLYSLEPLSGKDFLLGLLMPCMVTELGIWVVAIYRSSLLLMLYGTCNIFRYLYDLLLAFQLRKHTRALVLHHPTDIGFLVVL